ncbi:LysR family transcriptional regulator [Azospirillum halopraeferens]|uniref:LysR family transcriptional regulator n=1 Tax=Azospirillum halopraeferens TaxID=34010 RepID=UPI0003F6A7BB|nr:LysR family transcriptional regulator [Azospirillum halopraeferens]
MTDISLTLIQTFYMVARHGSYSAAARNLGLSYQSAANHVRRLEQILGERLVHSEQGVKQVALTPRGRSLYALLHPELDTMLERLSLVIRKQRPMLRIGLPQAIFFYFFPAVLMRFRERFPGVEILAYERDTVLAEMVKNGSLDVCVSERFFGDPVVPQRLLSTYRLALVFPRAWGPPPAPERAAAWTAGRPFITYEPGQTLRNLAVDFLTKGGAPPDIALSTSGSSSVKRCVEEGLGFSIIPSWCIGPADTAVLKVELPVLPEVPLYFGNAQFLTDSVYVAALYDACRAVLAPATAEQPADTGAVAAAAADA